MLCLSEFLLNLNTIIVILLGFIYLNFETEALVQGRKTQTAPNRGLDIFDY